MWELWLSKHMLARLDNSLYLTTVVVGWLLPLLRLHIFTLIHRINKEKLWALGLFLTSEPQGLCGQRNDVPI